MLKIIYFFRGYLRIKVTGVAPERFMNLCAARNIMLWNIEEEQDGYTMCITLKSFWTIRDIVRKTATKVVVLKRTGLPFFVTKIKKRLILLIGIFLFFLLFGISQMFLWQIKIEGNINIPENDIYECIQKQDIRIRMPKSSIDTVLLEKELRNTFPEITWVSVYLSGNELHIQIKENDKIILSEEDTQEKRVYDICASISGQIDYIITRQGTPYVKKGTEVAKGDVLVGGKVEIPDNDGNVKEIQYVAADADIIISGKIEKEFETPLQEEVQQYTGTYKEYSFFKIGDKYHLFNIFEERYDSYDIQILSEIEFSEKLPISFGIGNLRMREIKKITKEKTKEAYQKELQKMLDSYVASLYEKGIQITEKNVKIKKYMDNVKMEVVLGAKGAFVTKKTTPVSENHITNIVYNVETH